MEDKSIILGISCTALQVRHSRPVRLYCQMTSPNGRLGVHKCWNTTHFPLSSKRSRLLQVRSDYLNFIYLVKTVDLHHWPGNCVCHDLTRRSGPLHDRPECSVRFTTNRSARFTSRHTQPGARFSSRQTQGSVNVLTRSSVRNKVPTCIVPQCESKSIRRTKPVSDALNSTCNAAVTRCSVSCWLDLLCVSFMLLNLTAL
jgi:hypothetical protein